VVSALERRRARRVPAVLSVEVSDSAGFSIHSTRDISAGGVFFDSAIPCAVGTLVDLSFFLPGDAHCIRCQGEVVNVPNKQGYGMGIHFIELSPDDFVRLGKFIWESP
jgi:uncharacterized protein (TIGR02266 family)